MEVLRRAFCGSYPVEIASVLFILSNLNVLCTSASNTAKNGLGCLIVVPNQAARRKRVQHSEVTRFPDGAERKPDTKSGTQATARRKRAGACTRDDWGNVRVGVF